MEMEDQSCAEAATTHVCICHVALLLYRPSQECLLVFIPTSPVCKEDLYERYVCISNTPRSSIMSKSSES